MNSRRSQSSLANRSAYFIIAIASVALIVPASRETLAQTPPATESAEVTPNAEAQEAAPKIPDDQLDSLVSPIALYPDPLLAQTLAASTYRSKSSSSSSG